MGRFKRTILENNSWSIVDPMPTPRAYLGVVVSE